MAEYNGEKSTLGKLVTLAFVALLAIAALKLAFWLFGVAMGVGMVILFRLGPILLVGWLVMRFLRWLNRPKTDYPVA
jgi:hypothetical protein